MSTMGDGNTDTSPVGDRPITRADLEAKFKANAAYGGWSATESATALEAIGKLFRGPVDLAVFRR